MSSTSPELGSKPLRPPSRPSKSVMAVTTRASLQLPGAKCSIAFPLLPAAATTVMPCFTTAEIASQTSSLGSPDRLRFTTRMLLSRPFSTTQLRAVTTVPMVPWPDAPSTLRQNSCTLGYMPMIPLLLPREPRMPGCAHRNDGAAQATGAGRGLD